MTHKYAYRILLAETEEELRKAHLAVRAGIRGAEQRLARAEIDVDRLRRAVNAQEGKIRKGFGPEEDSVA